MLILITLLLALVLAGPANAAVVVSDEWNSKTATWLFPYPYPDINAVSPASPSGGTALRFLYPAGTYANSIGGGVASYESLSHTDLYFGHWARWSPGYTWNPVGTKLDYWKFDRNQIMTGGIGGGTLRTSGNGTNLVVDITNQQSGGNGVHTLFPNVSAFSFQTDRWYWVEFHAVVNTCFTCPEMQSDGLLEVWVNDVLIMRYTTVKYADVAGSRWKIFQHAPEWGGSGGTIPATQYYYVDHTVISTTRIGMPGGTSTDITPPGPVLNFSVQ